MKNSERVAWGLVLVLATALMYVLGPHPDEQEQMPAIPQAPAAAPVSPVPAALPEIPQITKRALVQRTTKKGELMTATGPSIAGTGANDSSIGGTFGNWANPSNVTANDTTVAQASPGSMAGGASHYLKATNFGFSIASDQAIDGITVEWRVRNNVGTTIDNAVRIVKGGTIGSTDKSSGTSWPGSLGTRTYGGASDLWGETWTYSDINSSSFGVALSAVNSGGDSQCDIDYVQVTIDHHTSTFDAFQPMLEAQTQDQEQSMIYLRKSTAGQEVHLGYAIDETDGATTLTALTIANTDIKILKAGATSEVSKNSGGATHLTDGKYYATFDATDTDTVGSTVITMHPAGALPRTIHCCILDGAIYDWLFGSTAPSTLGSNPAVNVTQWNGSAVATPDTAGVPKVNLVEWRGTTPSTMAAGAVRADLDSVKTQSVTCAAPVTILASVGTASTSTAQTGDGYAVVSSGTHGNAALKTLIDTVDNFIDTEIADIQSRIPDALVGGRIKAHVETMANNSVTAAALASDAVAEIQSGLATATDGTVVKVGAAFTSTAGTEVRISAWLERSGEVVVLPSGECTVAFREHGSGTDLFSVTDSAPNAQGIFEMTQSSPAFTSDRLYVASVEIEDDTAVVYTSKQAVPVR